MAQTIITLRADTRMASAFINLVSIPVFFGWRPSAKTQDRLATVASKLIRFHAE